MRERRITALPITNQDNTIADIVLLSEISGIFTERKPPLSGTPVVIMAGGQGTRLYPYTKILPKPLIPIGETPIVERIIDKFVDYDIDSFYITVNYKKGMIRSYFNDLKPGYKVAYVEEEKPLGTAGSLKLLEEIIHQSFFLVNCDSLIIADYAELLAEHKKANNMITIVSALKNFTIPYGVLNSGENGELLSIEEKPRLSYLINTGMYVIEPECIELIPQDSFFHMTDLIEKVRNHGGRVGIFPISEDSYLDMGEFSELKRMEQKLNVVE